MSSAPIPPNESKRLLALRDLKILDSRPEPDYDDLTWLVSSVCETPIALVSLVDEKRQWFKSCIGLTVQETPREFAFCAHAILEENILLIPDATKDGRFSDNPLVTGAPAIRFYAGVPLKVDCGAVLGTLCVIDTKPRNLTEIQIRTLHVVASQIIAKLNLRRTNQKMQNTLLRVNSIVDNLHGGILLQDKEGKVVFCNKAFLDIFSGNQPKPEAKAICPDGAKRIGEEIRLKNGSFLERDYIPVKDENGNTEHLWFYRDLTSRKQFERIVQFQRKRLDSLSKLSSLGIVASGIAHEINNPLTIISGRVSQLLAELDAIEGAVSNKKASLHSIKENAERIAQIIKALKVFSGDESKVAVSKILITNTIYNAYQLCRLRMKKHKVEFIVPETSGSLEFTGKEVQLLQVLVNLIGNAIDAVKALPERWIKIESLDQGTNIRINVMDSGKGISPTIRERIMIPFFTTKEVGKGTGLGLCLSKGFIEEMGGVLFLDDNASNTCFSFIIPKNKSQHLDTKSILIADDEPEIRQLISSHFAGKGWQVHEAENGKDALQVLGQNRVQVILSDIRMPESDGLELLELLRVGYSKKIPVFFLTAYADISREEAIARGAKDLLEKPFKIEEIYNTIESSLS